MGAGGRPSGDRWIPVWARAGGGGARTRTRTIRARLTALYGSVFLLCSAGLLTLAYLLVRHTLQAHHPYREALLRLGLHPAPGTEFGFRPGSTDARLVHALSQQIIGNALDRLLVVYVISLVVSTAIAVVAGWLLAGRALAPLREITAAARRVSGENLGERIALRGPDDELRELADTFDGMLARLDGAFASQRRFVASASHELRTPLAIMRTEVDVTLSDPAAGREELRAMGEAVRETVDRCEALIASLLLLARSEAAAVRVEPVDVAALAGDCVTDLRARAAEAGVAMTVAGSLGAAWVDGDPGLLERLVANLLDNGIHHNVAGGWLTVSVSTAASGCVVLGVDNGGRPLDADAVASLTQPFRRLDRSVPGFGLGLSIVESIATAHAGSVTLAPGRDGGLSVRVQLPGRAAPVAGPPAAVAVAAGPAGSSANPQVRLTGS